MIEIPHLNGLIAATYTPLHDNGGLNLERIAPEVDCLVGSGVSGLYVCGSTGEGMSLTLEERRSVAEGFIQATKGRVPVIVQVGRTSLAEARGLAAHAQEIGSDMVSATCPFYYKIDCVKTLVECMAEVAAGASETPFYYYHIPVLTGVKLDTVEFLRQGASKIPNLVGIKYTEPLLHEFQRCRDFQGGKFDIVWGSDEMLLGALATGAQAAIGSTYTVAAPLFTRMIDAFNAGRLEEARRLQFLAVQMVNALATHTYHPAMKELLKMLGRDCGPCRLPMRDLTSDEVKSLREKLELIDFFEWSGSSPSTASAARVACDTANGSPSVTMQKEKSV